MSYGDTVSVDPPATTAPAPRLEVLLRRLDGWSDRLSPIVVKEVRQIVRGREFNYSFMGSLLAGLIVAFFGAASASAGTGTTGQAVFGALTACLALLGVAIVPIGAFSALRNERLEQTMDLITVTSLSARKVVIGKLLAQAVKLATLFAGMAPFVATSFLLGGIDFVTIVLSLALVFFVSLWVCAAALLLSSLARSRGMSGALFVGGAFFLVLFFGGLQVVARLVVLGRTGGIGVAFGGMGPSGAPGWWAIAILTTFGAASLINLVLLAENRLSSPVEDKATALRAGFLGQFLVIIAAFTALAWFGPPAARIVEPLAALCLLHLAVVATFTVSEDFEVSRRVKRRMQARGWWRLPGALFWPGGGRGAAYVLAQMAALLLAAWRLADWPADVRWVLAGCGYICFFTGGPAMVLRYLRPGIRSFFIRVAALVLLSASLVLPDILYYLFVRPETFSLAYSGRHLLNPIRTLTNWNIVEAESLFAVPQVLGMLGLLSYIALMFMNSRATEPDAGPLITELNRAGSR